MVGRQTYQSNQPTISIHSIQRKVKRTEMTRSRVEPGENAHTTCSAASAASLMSSTADEERGVMEQSNGIGAERMPDDHSTLTGTGFPLSSTGGLMSNVASNETIAAQSVFSAMCRPGQMLKRETSALDRRHKGSKYRRPKPKAAVRGSSTEGSSSSALSASSRRKRSGLKECGSL
jgi:hypothetical protein